jgi:hypothetical protein
VSSISRVPGRGFRRDLEGLKRLPSLSRGFWVQAIRGSVIRGSLSRKRTSLGHFPQLMRVLVGTHGDLCPHPPNDQAELQRVPKNRLKKHVVGLSLSSRDARPPEPPLPLLGMQRCQAIQAHPFEVWDHVPVD